jgi:hypothetical protein
MKFWMLYATGGTAPTHRHLTREAAIEEAGRLIRERGRSEVFILETIGMMEYESPPFKYTPIVCSM